MEVTGELAAPFRQLQDCARRVAKVCVECKIELDADEYVKGFTPGIVWHGLAILCFAKRIFPR